MGWLLLLLAAALYFVTLDTGFALAELEGGDLITHQYAQVQARPSNAPGYPLYTMGGWLWFHGWRLLLQTFGTPLPNPTPILSSYSTLWALLSLWFLYRILLRLNRPLHSLEDSNWPLAWAISAFYAVTYFFWFYATTTEQYSSAIAHTLAIVYVYLLWEDTTVSSPIADRLLLLLALLCGLPLAHMVTVAMIVPPLVLSVLWRQLDLLRIWRSHHPAQPWHDALKAGEVFTSKPVMILGIVLSALAPTISYLYVYLRGMAHPEWWGEGNWATAQEWFWSFIRTAQGQDELSWGLQAGAPFFGNGFPQLIWQELSIPLLLLGLVGIGLLHGRLRLLLYGTLALYLILCWVDRFGNWFQVVLPAYPLVLIGLLPLAMAWQKRLVQVWPVACNRRFPTMDRWPLAIGVLAAVPVLLLLLAAGWRFTASWPAADSRNRPGDMALARPALLLAQPLPTGIGLFGEKADVLGLDYLISVWGIRPDLAVVSSPQAGQYIADGRGVAATWQATPLLLRELPGDLHVALQGITPDWVLLTPKGAGGELPTPQTMLGQSVGDGIVLVGYRIDAIAVGPRHHRQKFAWGVGGPQMATRSNYPCDLCPTLDVTLFWQVEEETTSEDWAISVRPFSAGAPIIQDGAPIQQDSPGPVYGLRPFSTIAPGQLVLDSYRLPSAQSADSLLVIVYRRTDSGFENLAELHLPRE